MKDKLPLFEDFIPFGVSISNKTKLNKGFSDKTGYNMNIITGPIKRIAEECANEAYKYEIDEYEEHKGEDLIKETKVIFEKCLQESYNKKCNQ